MKRPVTKKATNFTYDIEVVAALKMEALRQSQELGFKVPVASVANKFLRAALTKEGLLP